ncbi:MAG: hypothetical protein GX946_02310 [Oligosphaeraceae bacterium]|nr:hypothetical protein [Oligosphaeraceae bacterium]
MSHRFCTFHNIVILVILLCTGGCVTHPAKVRQYQNELGRGRSLDTGFSRQKIDPADKDGILLLLERFRLQQLQGDSRASTADFMLVHEYDRRLAEESPQIALSGLLQESAAVLLNEQVLPYRMSDFERVMLYQLQIFNSMCDEPEHVLPLVNNLSVYQQAIRDRYADLADSIENSLRSGANPNAGAAWQSISQNEAFLRHTAENSRAARQLASVENAYAYYFCALFFENQGKLGDAFMAYKAAWQLQQQNQCFLRDYLRLAKKLGKNEELKNFPDAAVADELPAGHGELVVFFEEGYIPAKQSVKLPPIPVPTAYGLILINIALPQYEPARAVSVPAVISSAGIGQKTELACDLRALALKELDAQMPAIVLRLALRNIARSTANYALLKGAEGISDQGGRELALFFLHLQQFLTVALEEPDLRSWLMLPNYTQVARLSLPAGQQQIMFQYRNQQQAITVDIAAGDCTVLHCSSVPGRFYFNQAKLPKSGWR